MFQDNLSFDIAVVGSGVAGLCAAVQASLLGKRVVLLETLSRFGGNWNGTYGIMAVKSPISERLGIEVDAQALVNQEVRLFNYVYIKLQPSAARTLLRLLWRCGSVVPNGP